MSDSKVTFPGRDVHNRFESAEFGDYVDPANKNLLKYQTMYLYASQMRSLLTHDRQLLAGGSSGYFERIYIRDGPYFRRTK